LANQARTAAASLDASPHLLAPCALFAAGRFATPVAPVVPREGLRREQVVRGGGGQQQHLGVSAPAATSSRPPTPPPPPRSRSAPGREQGQLGAAWAAATRTLHSAAPSAATAAHGLSFGGSFGDGIPEKKGFQPAKEAESPPAKEARGTLAWQTWPRSGRGIFPQQID